MQNFSFNNSNHPGKTKNQQIKLKHLDQSAVIVKPEEFMARSDEARALSLEDINFILRWLKNDEKLPQATSEPTAKSLVNNNFEQQLSKEDIKASLDIVPPPEYQKYSYTPPPTTPFALTVLTFATASTNLLISDNSTTTSTGSTGLSYKSDIHGNNTNVNYPANNYTIPDPTHDIPTQKNSAVIKNNHVSKPKKSSADLQHNKSNNQTQNTESSIPENKNNSTNSSTRESVEEKAISPAPNVGKVVHEEAPENNDIDQLAITSNSASKLEEKEESSPNVTPELPTEDSSSIEQEINTDNSRVKRYVNGGYGSSKPCGVKNGLTLNCHDMSEDQRSLVERVLESTGDIYSRQYGFGKAITCDVKINPMVQGGNLGGLISSAVCRGEYSNTCLIELAELDENIINIGTVAHEITHAYDYANGKCRDTHPGLHFRAELVRKRVEELWENQKYSPVKATAYSQTPNANLYDSHNANNKVIIFSLNPASNKYEAHECPKNIINAAIPVPIFDIKNNKSCSTVPTSSMKSADTDIIIIKNDNSWIKYDSKTETLNSGSDSGTGSITLYECPPSTNPRCKWAQNNIKSFACSVAKESSPAHVKQTAKYLLDDIIEAYCRPAKNINYDPTKPSGQLHTPPIVAEYPASYPDGLL